MKRKVKDDPKYIKDTSTGSVVNTDRSQYQVRVNQLKAKADYKKQVDDRLTRLESSIEQILEILQRNGN